MSLTFKAIDKTNWIEAAKLKVKPDQESYVSSNTFSMLQAIYDDQFECEPQGIYDGDTMVGFIMTAQTEESRAENMLWIMRYMVGSDYQRKGYGQAALQQFIDHVRSEGQFKHIKITYVPENTVAQALYARAGFVEEGLNEEWGEIVARLDL